VDFREVCYAGDAIQGDLDAVIFNILNPQRIPDSDTGSLHVLVTCTSLQRFDKLYNKMDFI
jgi:hypothetical protein